MPHGSLFTLLSTTGPLDIPCANSLFLKLLATVNYLHQNNISHGDLKPDNILISAEFQVKVCDFGFASSNSSTSLMVGGSEGYNAPEIFTMPEMDLKKCDLFSLGVVFFIIATACPPFMSNNP
jgi:serine/threonine-protein kinase ULK/ATG1/calcium/calmodulin-dependent protein kinase I